MIWSEFVTLVTENLGVNGTRRGIENLRKRALVNSVVDLQRFIRGYRQGHTTTYGAPDLTEVGQAHLGDIPANQIPAAFFMFSTEVSDDGTSYELCRRNRLRYLEWNRIQEMICGQERCRDYLYSIGPYGKNFMVYPALTDTSALLMVYEGLKSNFLDGDVVPWGPDAGEACAAYVLWTIHKQIDKNPGMAQQEFENYRRLRLGLIRTQQETMDAEKTADIFAADAMPNYSLQNFGAQSIPRLRSVTAYLGTTTAALAALITSSLPVPFTVVINISGIDEMWDLELGLLATDVANGLVAPNDQSALNARTWHKRT